MSWTLSTRYRRAREAGMERPLRYVRRYAQWSWTQRFGPRVRIEAPDRMSAVLLNWKRPHNIGPIVSSLLRCEFVERVVVVNNNPELRARELVTSKDARLELRDEDANRGPIHRYAVAAGLDAEYLLALDDDLFLDGRQLALLFRRLLADPAVPHGGTGQRVDASDAEPASAFTSGVQREDGEIDVLNRFYAFTREHARRALELREASAGVLSEADSAIADDVFLSFAGRGRPRIHDVGRFLDCPTSGRGDVALYRRAGFKANRLLLYRHLCEQTGRH